MVFNKHMKLGKNIDNYPIDIITNGMWIGICAKYDTANQTLMFDAHLRVTDFSVYYLHIN